MKINIKVEEAPGRFPGVIVKAIKTTNGKFGATETIILRTFLCPPGVGQSAVEYEALMKKRHDDAHEYTAAVSKFFEVST